MNAELSEVELTLPPVSVLRKMNCVFCLRKWTERPDREDQSTELMLEIIWAVRKSGGRFHRRWRQLRAIRAKGRPGKNERGEILPYVIESDFTPRSRQLGPEAELSRDWIRKCILKPLGDPQHPPLAHFRGAHLALVTRGDV